MKPTHALLALTMLACAAAAHASPERGGMRWTVDSVVLELVGDDAVIDSTATLGAAERAAEAWNGFGIGPQLTVVRASNDVQAVASYDQHNVISFHHGAWNGIVGAAAQTQRVGDAVNGLLFEADVTINGGEIPFCTDGGAAGVDLQSTLTHELGHVLGLLDDHEHEDATMFSSARLGDTSRRTLSEHDTSALAALYQGAELRPGSGGCSSTEGQGWWWVLALIPGVAARRAARRSR